mmetsp:Transcript_118396/g.252764  ORF Transcript_118396/g.252764 Transcript_118396/m.252764 type:complete len:209 (-) Transcript_118396:289-915(-)
MGRSTSLTTKLTLRPARTRRPSGCGTSRWPESLDMREPGKLLSGSSTPSPRTCTPSSPLAPLACSRRRPTRTWAVTPSRRLRGASSSSSLCRPRGPTARRNARKTRAAAVLLPLRVCLSTRSASRIRRMWRRMSAFSSSTSGMQWCGVCATGRRPVGGRRRRTSMRRVSARTMTAMMRRIKIASSMSIWKARCPRVMAMRARRMRTPT